VYAPIAFGWPTRRVDAEGVDGQVSEELAAGLISPLISGVRASFERVPIECSSVITPVIP